MDGNNNGRLNEEIIFNICDNEDFSLSNHLIMIIYGHFLIIVKKSDKLSRVACFKWIVSLMVNNT